MIWVTMRQQRLEALLGAAVLALVVALLLHTGLDMYASYARNGVDACLARPAWDDGCTFAVDAFRRQFNALDGLFDWFNFLPLIFGVLLAAPFVLELEGGTYRLAWTQSITRLRWVGVKIGLIVAVAALLGLAATALMSWWHGPLDRLDGRFRPSSFDFEGTVPVAYTVFAVALVLALGTLLRRTVAALGIGLVAFLAVRLGVQGQLRPRYLEPLTSSGPHGSAGFQRGDWLIDDGWRDRAGHAVDSSQMCPPTSSGSDKAGFFACMSDHHAMQYTTYQPADRFWTFQLIETALFLGLAAALLALTVWWVHHRIS